jgi:hypothetical protein
MTWFNIPSTFIKTINHLNSFWNIFVFLSTHVHCICFHKYTPISYFIKWNEILYFSKLYYNIIYKNIVKIFEMFEVGYIQTCTSLESSTMWHPKGGNCNVFSPKKILSFKLNVNRDIFVELYFQAHWPHMKWCQIFQMTMCLK